MAIQQINIGQAPNDGTGDQLRSAFAKANANFTDLDTRANAAWARANEGVAAAAAAQSAADGAASGATAAQATADGAQATADDAIGAATAAQSTADGAVTAAGAAQADATSALTQVSTRAPIANPSFTGIAVAPDIAISKATGTNRRLLLRSDGVDRWGLESNGAAESGANAGSNLVVRRYSDTGTAVDTPFMLDRATGRLAVGPSSTAVDANAALLVNGGVRAGSWFLPGAFTFATLPTVSAELAGAIAYCSNAAGGASDVQCSGTEWLSLKTGLPADLQPTGGSGSKFWRRNADGTMEAWGSETIDMGGSNWAGLGPNGGRLTVTGTITYGGPAFVAAPLGVASWIDGDVSTWCSYMAYYSLGTAGVGGGIELISPFSRGVRGPGSGIISYNVRGRWRA